MEKKGCVSFVALSFIISGYLHAETQNPITKSYLELLPIDTFVNTLSLEELSELVVTDTKIAQSSRSVTQNTLIINHTEFERLGDNRRNIAELLQYTSGQFINVLSRNDANWGSYAGLGPKYNTYMLDGLPIDSFADAMSLDPWAFERVEIQKGPASILYSNYMSMDFAGNESPLAGTTNFILKEKIDSQMTRAQLGLGSYQTKNGRIYHQDKRGDLSYFIGGNIEKSNYSQYGEAGSWLQTTDNPDYRKTKLYGKLSYAIDTGQTLSLFFHHTDHTGDLGRPNRDFDHSYDTWNLKYNNQLTDALGMQVQLGLRNNVRGFVNDGYPASLEFTNTESIKQKIIPADITFNYRHGANNTLSIGTDAQWTQYQYFLSSSIQNDVKAVSNSLFAQEKVTFGDWIIRGGIRYNSIKHDYSRLGGDVPAIEEATWTKTLWNVGLRWNPSSSFSWYANSGTSYMAPSAKQVGGTIGQVANPSLQNELGMGNDMGIEIRPLENMKIGMRGFYNVINDAIVDDLVNLTSFNAGKITTKGLELDFNHQRNENFEYFANITYTDTKLKDSINPVNDGSDIPFVPKYVANFGMSVIIPADITMSAYLQQVGKYYNSTNKTERMEFGNYHTINGKLQKNLYRSAKYSINALLDLNNIGNSRYTMPWGFVDPGFNAMASVQISF